MAEAAYCLTCWWNEDECEDSNHAYQKGLIHICKNLGHDVRITVPTILDDEIDEPKI